MKHNEKPYKWSEKITENAQHENYAHMETTMAELIRKIKIKINYHRQGKQDNVSRKHNSYKYLRYAFYSI